MRAYPRPIPQSSSPGGPCHRRKGDRCERELIQRHRAIGVHAERYPLSGASRFRGVVTTSMRSAVTRRRWSPRRRHARAAPASVSSRSGWRITTRCSSGATAAIRSSASPGAPGRSCCSGCAHERCRGRPRRRDARGSHHRACRARLALSAAEPLLREGWSFKDAVTLLLADALEAWANRDDGERP
jgi:hypothetical protein